MRLLGLICEIKTMNEISREFNTKETIKNIAIICGLELDEILHHNIISDVFEKVEVAEMERINKILIKKY